MQQMEHKKRPHCQRSGTKGNVKNENIDIIFLTETDTNSLQKEDGYKIQGYKTVFQERKSDNSKLRIVCLLSTANIPLHKCVPAKICLPTIQARRIQLDFTSTPS